MVTSRSQLEKDFGIDSLDKIEIAIEIERSFGIAISDDDVLRAHTIHDLETLVERRMKQHENQKNQFEMNRGR